MYRGFEYGRALQSASQIFNSAVSTRGVLDPDNAVETYREANETRFRVVNEMYRTIENMRKSGKPDYEIRKALRKNKVADVNALMRGRFVPFRPSSEIRKRVRGYGNRLPMPEINAIRREFRQRDLGEPVEEQKELSPVDDNLFSDAQDDNLFSNAQPVQQPVAAAPAPPVAAQAGVGSPLSTSAPVSIANNQQLNQQLVGGGNPINAIKNAQISRTV